MQIHYSDIAMQKIDNEWFVKNVRNQELLRFSDTMFLLWSSIVEREGQGDWLDHFCKRFPPTVRAQARLDAAEVSADLEATGLVTLSEPDGALSKSISKTATDCSRNAEIEQFMFYKAITKRQPLLVEYEMTYRCNLRCAYCYQPEWLKHQWRGELDEAAIASMLDDFASSGVFYLVLTGGECTLSHNFRFAVTEARRRHLDVKILTNATKIDSALGEFLGHSGVSAVKVSIYGNNPAKYGQFTRSQIAFERVIDGLTLLQNYGVPVIAKVVVTSEHEDSWEATADMLESRGIPLEFSAHVMPAMDGSKYPLRYRVSTETLRKLAARRALKSGGTVCTAGTAKFRIAPDGSVTTCELVREIIGNIRNEQLLEISRREATKALVRRLSVRAAALKENPATSGLACPALPKIETGDWDKPADEAVRWTSVLSSTSQIAGGR